MSVIRDVVRLCSSTEVRASSPDSQADNRPCSTVFQLLLNQSGCPLAARSSLPTYIECARTILHILAGLQYPNPDSSISRLAGFHTVLPVPPLHPQAAP